MLSGRLWYVNANNNGGRGYGFCVEKLTDLIEKEMGSFYVFETYPPVPVSGVVFTNGKVVMHAVEPAKNDLTSVGRMDTMLNTLTAGRSTAAEQR